jgi:hypothetical protein
LSLSNTIDLRAATIRRLNDAFRTTFMGGRIMLTAGVNGLPDDTKANVLSAVRQYADFKPDSDPHGEHDFGVFEVQGEKLYWKIDYYDQHLQGGSENPADPSVTTRVLTILKREEY